MYTRLLQLPSKPKQSFFLWGQRQTGKTTLLKAAYPEALRIDLLKPGVAALLPPPPNTAAAFSSPGVVAPLPP